MRPPISYLEGTSLFHRTDSRVKLAAMVLLSLGAAGASGIWVAAVTVVLLALIRYSGLSLLGAARQLIPFLVLLLFVFISRVLSENSPPDALWFGVPVSQKGLMEGLLVAGRLLAVCILGVFLVTTTTTAHIRQAVQWFLKPVPFVPHARVAFMLGLLIRFIPEIFQTSHRISQAQQARLLENRKNPVVRLRAKTVPLFIKTFENADHLSNAMAARLYNDQRQGPEFSITRTDMVLAVLAVACFAASWL